MPGQKNMVLAPSDFLFPYLKNTSVDGFSTDDELKYATKEWLKEQSELFLRASENSEIATNCALTKAVIMLKKVYDHPLCFI